MKHLRNMSILLLALSVVFCKTRSKSMRASAVDLSKNAGMTKEEAERIPPAAAVNPATLEPPTSPEVKISAIGPNNALEIKVDVEPSSETTELKLCTTSQKPEVCLPKEPFYSSTKTTTLPIPPEDPSGNVSIRMRSCVTVTSRFEDKDGKPASKVEIQCGKWSQLPPTRYSKGEKFDANLAAILEAKRLEQVRITASCMDIKNLIKSYGEVKEKVLLPYKEDDQFSLLMGNLSNVGFIPCEIAGSGSFSVLMDLATDNGFEEEKALSPVAGAFLMLGSVGLVAGIGAILYSEFLQMEDILSRDARLKDILKGLRDADAAAVAAKNLQMDEAYQKKLKQLKDELARLEEQRKALEAKRASIEGRLKDGARWRVEGPKGTAAEEEELRMLLAEIEALEARNKAAQLELDALNGSMQEKLAKLRLDLTGEIKEVIANHEKTLPALRDRIAQIPGEIEILNRGKIPSVDELSRLVEEAKLAKQEAVAAKLALGGRPVSSLDPKKVTWTNQDLIDAIQKEKKAIETASEGLLPDKLKGTKPETLSKLRQIPPEQLGKIKSITKQKTGLSAWDRFDQLTSYSGETLNFEEKIAFFKDKYVLKPGHANSLEKKKGWSSDEVAEIKKLIIDSPEDIKILGFLSENREIIAVAHTLTAEDLKGLKIIPPDMLQDSYKTSQILQQQAKDAVTKQSRLVELKRQGSQLVAEAKEAIGVTSGGTEVNGMRKFVRGIESLKPTNGITGISTNQQALRDILEGLVETSSARYDSPAAIALKKKLTAGNVDTKEFNSAFQELKKLVENVPNPKVKKVLEAKMQFVETFKEVFAVSDSYVKSASFDLKDPFGRYVKSLDELERALKDGNPGSIQKAFEEYKINKTPIDTFLSSDLTPKTTDDASARKSKEALKRAAETIDPHHKAVFSHVSDVEQKVNLFIREGGEHLRELEAAALRISEYDTRFAAAVSTEATESKKLLEAEQALLEATARDAEINRNIALLKVEQEKLEKVLAESIALHDENIARLRAALEQEEKLLRARLLEEARGVESNLKREQRLIEELTARYKEKLEAAKQAKASDIERVRSSEAALKAERDGLTGAQEDAQRELQRLKQQASAAELEHSKCLANPALCVDGYLKAEARTEAELQAEAQKQIQKNTKSGLVKKVGVALAVGSVAAIAGVAIYDQVTNKELALTDDETSSEEPEIKPLDINVTKLTLAIEEELHKQVPDDDPLKLDETLQQIMLGVMKPSLDIIADSQRKIQVTDYLKCQTIKNLNYTLEECNDGTQAKP